MTKALLVGGGPIGHINIEDVASDRDVFGIDSGYDSIPDHITPNYLIGDMDSVQSVVDPSIEKLDIKGLDSVYTDMELAIRSAIDLGYRDIIVLGALGGRVDHTIVNMEMLAKFLDYDVDITLQDGKNLIRASIEDISIDKNDYTYLSIVPLYDGTVVSISGVEYPLDDAEIYIGDSLTISNQIVNETAQISSDRPILIIQTKE